MPWLLLLAAGFYGKRRLEELFSLPGLAGTTLVCGSASGTFIGHMGPCPPQGGFSWSNPDWDARANNWAAAVADGLGLRYVTNVDYQPGNAVFADDVGQATIDNPAAGGAPLAFPDVKYPAWWPNLEHWFPELRPLGMPVPVQSPGARPGEPPDSDWDQGYKRGDENGPERKLLVGLQPGTPRFMPRAPGDVFPNGINTPIAAGSGPVPYAAAPNVAVDVNTATGVVSTGSGGYSNNPPGADATQPPKGEKPRSKEKKIKTNMHPRMLLLKVFNAWTEANDAVNALWKALPAEVRRKKNGKRGAVSRQEKIEQVYNNFSKINWRNALRNIAENEINDFYVGQIGQLGKRAQQNFDKAGYTFGGPTFGTRTTKQTGVGRAPEWSLPEWDL